MTLQETAHTPEIPLRAGDPAHFERVASILREAGFDEENVRRTLKIEEMPDLSRVNVEEADLGGAGERLALFIRLFIFTLPVPRLELDRLLDAATIESFFALDLLRPADFAPGSCYSPVFFYPVAGLLIASDRHNHPDGSPFTPPPDIVFPAISVGTMLFLQVIPRSATGAVLDLGTGTGVAAFALSRTAERVVALDITPRAAHFARFNRLLNRCENVEIKEGDLYQPVAGQTFDRIVSHPPYTPSLTSAAIYRDGGETGERLVRRLVEGAPAHLRPGGTLYVLCIGHDTREGSFEARARAWLGASASEFDLLFAKGDENSVQDFMREMAAKTEAVRASDAERMSRALEELGTIKLVYGVIAVHRRPAETRDREPWTARTSLSKITRGEAFARAFRWREISTAPDFPARLAQARPRLAPPLRVNVTHLVREGALVPVEFVLETEHPFPLATRVDPWLVPVIAEFNGRRSVAELYEAARGAGALPEQCTLEDFLHATTTLVERGYLLTDEE